MTYLRFVILFLLWALTTNAQFYNGLQTDFGKNRVQYQNFLWQYYRFAQFDVYFYENGSKLAEFVALKAQQYLPELESKVGNTLQKRIIFLVYNNLSDFRQSNIGLVTGNDQYNVGGTTQLIDNKVFLYYEGDHYRFEKQIKAAIAQILVDQTLYGSDFKSKVTNSTLLNLPDWFYKGLISFLSEEWSSEIDNVVRDGIISNRYEKFNRLTGNDAIYAGHSMWYFIYKKFGKQTIPNILYLTRISKNVETGFLYTIGLPIKYLNYEWLDYFKTIYFKDEQKRIPPPENFITKKIKSNTIIQQTKLSPDGQWLVYATNTMGRIKIYLKNIQTNSFRCIYRQGVRLDQITDYSYPIIAWHPSNKLVAFITEKKGSRFLYTYEIETKELSEKELFQVQKILDFDFSHNGFNIVMSAVKDGYTDIFVFNNASNIFEQITKDIADDRYPKFIEQSQKILFSSNRASERIHTDSIRKTYDVFIYDYKSKDTLLTRITNLPLSNEILPYYYKKNEYILLSDESGLFNRYTAQYDSVISYIDTATHYRYFTNISPITNYSRNIIEHDLSMSGQITNLFNFKNKMYATLELTNAFKANEKVNSPFLKDIHKNYKDTVIKKETEKLMDTTKIKLLNIDTNNIDIQHYIFNFQIHQLKGQLRDNQSENTEQKLSFKPMIYLTSFYTNSLTSQVDFGFLSNSYQPFTGGPFYYNPGLNVFFKLGTNDLFEDYKIIGGVRFAGNFNSNEYLISFENLKKRLDKQIVFHRLALNKINNVALMKTHTHEMFYILRYPFNQVLATRFTTQYRYDRTAYMATDVQTLKQSDEINLWLGLKGELIYDNTISKGLNLLFGTRAKMFFETYYQTNKQFQSLYVSGFDVRHYQPIHRTFIWASRLAASNSFGKAKLIYYLGSVDNWINLSTKVPLFDPSVRIDPNQNYVYQAIATNMRGFPQNIRNGNNFVVWNNELRLPIVKYIMNRPIHSDFFENLQIIGFIDAGTAWSGKSPYSKENAYNTEIIQQGPITIIIDKKRDPIVWGYGFGLRSRLLGYFVRADWAWGVENNMILPMIFYLSLSTDF
ncbi:MAG: hypothetical protein N2449_07215 [Bacteroidales bacterium]|nr:hypothetical protein [Bacteroidales bacterium]